LKLYLDLGDVITKVIAVSKGNVRRFLYPSVVARSLLDDQARAENLLLDNQESMIRPSDFDPDKYPRTRSYPREDAYLNEIQPPARARFAGRIAVALGQERELLGRHPTEENIDALVHKAFFKCAEGCRKADLVFIVDTGPKAEAILRYAQASPRDTKFLKWKVRQSRPVLIQLSASGRIVDAADCVTAALPDQLALDQVGRLLVIDIGYIRTKLAIISTKGCEHQEQLDELGVSDCVRRILRDGQDRGLVEDEYAVARALEKSIKTIEVAGRRFYIGRTFETTRKGLEDDLARAAQRVMVEVYGRSGEMCKAVAIIGGGAAIAGQGVAARLNASDIGLEAVWVAKDTRFFLAEGARRIHS
jgi:hypothetical protein